MNKEELHAALDEFKFSAWPQCAVVHAMIDLGYVTKLECQLPDCRFETRELKKFKDHKGDPLSLTIDHVLPRRDAANHRIENLRIVHAGCNFGWRKGLPGTHLDADARRRISEGVKAAHAAGRFVHIYTPERNAKISASKKVVKVCE